MQKKIPKIFQQNEGFKILSYFTVVEGSQQVTEVVPSLMQQYNLLPNDAIILATCKIFNIPFLATYDNDLKTAGEQERLQILSD